MKQEWVCELLRVLATLPKNVTKESVDVVVAAHFKGKKTHMKKHHSVRYAGDTTEAQS